MNQLIHCIYASKASRTFQEHAIPDLLAAARRNNADRGITGMLLYIEGNFFQVLEGEETAVTEVFERIRLDPRHGRVTLIIREPLFERAFSDWSMGFVNAGVEEVRSRLGENDFFSGASCLEQLSPGRARKLLRAFGQGRWRADETGVHPPHGKIA